MSIWYLVNSKSSTIPPSFNSIFHDIEQVIESVVHQSDRQKFTLLITDQGSYNLKTDKKLKKY